MDTYERIKLLRTELGMSQEEFGKKLGVSRSVIANIEYDRLKRPDQKEPIYRLICEKFDVNEQWLRTGEGSMYIELTREENIAGFVGKILRNQDDTFQKRFIDMLSKLDEDGWEALEKVANAIAEMKKG